MMTVFMTPFGESVSADHGVVILGRDLPLAQFCLEVCLYKDEQTLGKTGLCTVLELNKLCNILISPKVENLGRRIHLRNNFQIGQICRHSPISKQNC